MLSTLYAIRKAVMAVAMAANSVGVIVLFGLVIIMNIDVISRNAFHAPLRGVVEVVIFSLVLIVFLQLPDVVRSDRLTRSDGFLSVMKNSRPGVEKVTRRLIDAVAAVFMVLIAWTVWPEFVEAFESCHFFTPPEFGAQPTGDFWVDFKAASARCDYFGTPGIFTAPWWPARLAIFFGVTWSALVFAFKATIGDGYQPNHAESH